MTPPDSRPTDAGASGSQAPRATTDPLHGAPLFRTIPPQPCDACPIHMWAALTNPEAANLERWARRDERRILASLVKKSMTTDNIRRLSLTNQKLLAELAQILLRAIAEREAA